MGACTGTLPRRPNPRPRTHHMLCLQVPPQLLAEVFRTEFHGHSPAGEQAGVPRAPPSALTEATSSHAAHFRPS